MTYKLHANFATVQSFQASSWKEKDGLHAMKQYPRDLMSETDSISLAFDAQRVVQTGVKCRNEIVGYVTLKHWVSRQWKCGTATDSSANCAGSCWGKLTKRALLRVPLGCSLNRWFQAFSVRELARHSSSQ